MLVSGPGVWGTSRGQVVESKDPVDAAGWSGGADPLLVIPIKATAAGAALFAYLVWFPPGLPSFGIAMTLWGLFAAFLAALWVRRRRRRLRICQSGVSFAPGPVLRLLQAAALALAICARFVELGRAHL